MSVDAARSRSFTGLNESSTVVDDEDDDPTASASFYYARMVVVGATMVTFAWGFSGNLLVLYVVGRHANVRVKSVANYYVWNMALADILYVSALPLTGFVTYTDSWPFRRLFGTISCKLAYVMRETTRYTSIYTLAVLAFDRCLASYPSRRRFRTIRCGKIICAVVWLCSFIATSPLIVFAKSITFKHETGLTTKCLVVWPNKGTDVSDLFYIIPWTAFDNVYGFLVPTVAIVTSYVRLFQRMRRFSARAHGGVGGGAAAVHLATADQSGTDNADETATADRTMPSSVTGSVSRHSRMTHTVTVAVAIHVALLLPYHVTQVISVERTAKLMTSEEAVLSPAGVHAFVWSLAVAQLLVFVSSCCNPVIYGIMNENFRHLYVTTLCPCTARFKRRQQPPPPPVERLTAEQIRPVGARRNQRPVVDLPVAIVVDVTADHDLGAVEVMIGQQQLASAVTDISGPREDSGSSENKRRGRCNGVQIPNSHYSL